MRRGLEGEAMTKGARYLLVVLPLLLFLAGCPLPDDGGGDEEPAGDYRQEMREFVQSISGYAKAANSSFLVTVRNAGCLLTEDGTGCGFPCIAYVNALDGLVCESVLYGYVEDDCATPAGDRDCMIEMLDWAEARGVEVLVVDYCTTRTRVDTSYAWNGGRGFASLATVRSLNSIPSYPAQPYNVNADNVTTLGGAKNLLYVLDSTPFGTADAYLWQLQMSNYDVLIVDAFHQGELLTAGQVASLKTKANGGTRLVLAYMNIGEAQDYRYYWQAGWGPGMPVWLGAENPAAAGHYDVAYWHSQWKAIILGSENAYLDRLLAAGFDGVCLGGASAFERFE